MKTKAQKMAEAKRNAEAEKAKRKQLREAKAKNTSAPTNGKKGKSIIAQSKAKK